MATVSSHILDAIAGCSASGITVELHRLGANGDKEELFQVEADGEGRISQSVQVDPSRRDAQYELVFHSAGYFAGLDDAPTHRQVMDVVVVRIAMPDPDARYHIPLVLSPHSYTIWWSG